MSRSRRHCRVVAVAALSLCFVAGCRDDMRNQPRHRPLDASSMFEDGRSSRPLVPGTVARGYLREDSHLNTGRVNNEYATTLPFPLTRAVMERGRERFGIFCTPCHDQLGTGRGMAVRRGLKRPPSFHIERLRNAPHGYFFDVITNGFGVMKSYANVIAPQDRWAIIAYLRALQLSQSATVDDVPAGERAALELEEGK